MLWPLLLMALGFKLFYVSLLLIRVQSELVSARIRALQMTALRESADAPAAALASASAGKT